MFSFFCFHALLQTAFVRFLQTNEGKCDRNFLPVTSFRPVSMNMIHNGTAPALIVSILRLKNRSNITLKFTLEHKVKTQQDLFSHVKVIHSSRYLESTVCLRVQVIRKMFVLGLVLDVLMLIQRC